MCVSVKRVTGLLLTRDLLDPYALRSFTPLPEAARIPPRTMDIDRDVRSRRPALRPDGLPGNRGEATPPGGFGEVRWNIK